jgi:hypothetical protein
MPENNDPHDLFDLAFKRLMRLSNTAVVTFINSLFGERHPLTSKVDYLATEEVDNNLNKTISDKVIGIDGIHYLIDIQRKNDNSMAIRIFEYTYADALNTKNIDDDGVIFLEFPKATVIYLKNTGKTEETLHLRFPDRSMHTFTVPVLNLLEYSIPDLEKKNLYLLLPFYVLKLHDKIKKAKSSDERRLLAPQLIALIQEIEAATDRAVEAGMLSYEDTIETIELLDRIYNHLYSLFNELQEANKMAEQFLELKCDKILKELREEKQKAEKETWQKAEQETWQKAAREYEHKFIQKEQAIAANLRGFGLTDEQIRSAISVN